MSTPFKMKSPLLHWGKHPSKKDGHTKADHKGLRKAKKEAILEEKEKFKSGEITRKEYKSAKEEIRKYTDY